MHYDIGYFDLEACRVEPVDNPFGPKVLSMSPVNTVSDWRARQDESGHWEEILPLL